MATSLDPIRKALARRAATSQRRTVIVRDGLPPGAGDTAAHRPFELPAGVCMLCGTATATATAWRPLPGFTRGVSGSTCPACADALTGHDGALVPFVTSALAGAYPDRSVLAGPLRRPPTSEGAAVAATWAAHVRGLFVAGRPTYPPASATRWAHCRTDTNRQGAR